MDGQRFDQLTRALARGTSRQHMLRALAEVAAGDDLGVAEPRERPRLPRERHDLHQGRAVLLGLLRWEVAPLRLPTGGDAVRRR